MTTMLQWAQTKAGISEQILVNTSIRLPQLESEKYVSTLRKYYQLSGLGLHLTAIQTVELKRLNDRAIMDMVGSMARSEISDRLIVRINRCRIFLRAETLADLVTSDGKAIRSQAFECKVNARVWSKKLWPNQPHIGKEHIKTWQWFLRKLCKPGTVQLVQPLGKWVVEPPHCGWSAYYDENTGRVLARYQGAWAECEIKRETRTEWILDVNFQSSISEEEWNRTEDKFPLDCEVCMITNELYVGKPTGSSNDWRIKSVTPEMAKTWTEYISVLPKCDRDLLKGCKELSYPNAPALWEILGMRHRELNIVSDGGHCGE
jgi:hypothetical protein